MFKHRNKRRYGKLDYELYKEARAQGKTKVDAGRIPGSEAKYDSTVINTVNNKLANDSSYKLEVINAINKRRQEALEAMTPQKASEASYQQLATSVGILIDKVQLLQGDPTIISQNNQQLVFYEETDSDITQSVTTGITDSGFTNSPGAIFEHVNHSWTEVAERVKIHGATHTMDWTVWKLSAFDVKARMLERVARAIVESEDSAIYTELATTTNTATAVETWDNATESLQQPLKDILIARSALKLNNWTTSSNLKMIIHPTNFMELLNNPVIRNAGQFYTDGVTRNGVVGKIADFVIIESNAMTENTIRFCISQTAMSLDEAQGITTQFKEETGETITIKAFSMSVPVLINNNAAYKLTAA